MRQSGSGDNPLLSYQNEKCLDVVHRGRRRGEVTYIYYRLRYIFWFIALTVLGETVVGTVIRGVGVLMARVGNF